MKEHARSIALTTLGLTTLVGCSEQQTRPDSLPPVTSIEQPSTPMPSATPEYIVVTPETRREIQSTPEAELPRQFLKGFNYLEYGYEGLGSDLASYREDTVGPILDRIQKDGANSVTYIFPYHQENLTSSAMDIEQVETPSDEVIRAFTSEAHVRGIEVILRPFMHLTDEQGKWRGEIEPTDPDAWFQSHEEVMLHYLQLAQEEGIEHVSFGSELTSMEQEQYTEQWSALLDKADEVYAGDIMFSINWGPYVYGNGINTDLLTHPAIDTIGLSYYYAHPEVPLFATEQQLTESMEGVPVEELTKIHALTDKPIMIVEIGATSTFGPWKEPWMSPPSENVPVSTIRPHEPVWSEPRAYAYEQDQANYFSAACEAIVGNEALPFVTGMHVWMVDAGSEDVNASTDRGFEVLNKDAETAISECFTVFPSK